MISHIEKRKTYSVLLHRPARREDDEIGNGSTRLLRLAGENSEDGGILMTYNIK